jgi:hypothetical protein
MRIIQKLAAVVALSITTTSFAATNDVARLGDFVPELRQTAPVSGAHSAASQATQTSQGGCSISLAGPEPEFSGCTRSQIEGYGGGQRVAQATPAPEPTPAPAKCTPVVSSSGDLAFQGQCSARQIDKLRAKLAQGTESADPIADAAKAIKQARREEFALGMAGMVLGAATDRVFYGRNGYGRGGSYNSYNRGGGNTRGSGTTWVCQAGQYCP